MGGYRTSVAQYVAEWGMAPMRLSHPIGQSGGYAPYGVSAGPAEKLSCDTPISLVEPSANLLLFVVLSAERLVMSIQFINLTSTGKCFTRSPHSHGLSKYTCFEQGNMGH